MSSLFKNLRIHQIFGSNTNVGKTVLTTALVNASVARNAAVYYLKPISTGPPEEADEVYVCVLFALELISDERDRHVKRYAKSNLVDVDCLFRFGEPVSPHLAAKLAASGDTPHEVHEVTHNYIYPEGSNCVDIRPDHCRHDCGSHQKIC